MKCVHSNIQKEKDIMNGKCVVKCNDCDSYFIATVTDVDVTLETKLEGDIDFIINELSNRL